MATMQDHPIDLVREQMAQVARSGGRGLLGLACGLGLIGLLWLGAMKPANAAGLIPTEAITAQALADGHLGAPVAVPLAVVMAVPAPTVCRLVIDPEALVPLPPACAAP